MRKANAIAATLLLVGAHTAHAQLRPLGEAGWDFTLNLSVGYVTSENNFSTSDDNQTITEYGSPENKNSTAIVYPLGRVQYTTRDLRNQFYIGNSSEQISNAQFQYEFGYTHQSPALGEITIAYFPQLPFLNSTWEDPYLLDAPRVETEENATGARIAWQQLFGSPLTLKYAYANIDVENENSGAGDSDITDEQRKLLNRDGNAHRLELETMFPFAKGWFLRPGLQSTFRDADGAAVAFTDYTAKLGILHFNAPHTFILNFEGGKSETDEANPIFETTIKDTHYSGFFIYDYAGIFGLQNASLNAVAGYTQSDANVDFYNSTGLITSIGMTYRF
jgi:hypothetical protein